MTLKTLKLAFCKAFLGALGLIIVAGPLVLIQVNEITGAVELADHRVLKLVIGAYLAAFFWGLFRGSASLVESPEPRPRKTSKVKAFFEAKYEALSGSRVFWLGVLVSLVALPLFISPYGLKVGTSVLIYIALGLGLNIIVGLSGLLHLGYAAFYGVGAYVYAMLGHYLGWGFWVCLPLGGLAAALLGLALGLPVIRLTGDYLAIVTLGFGEIFRQLLTNLSLTNGPRGIDQIAPPGFFGLDLNLTFKPFFVAKLGLNPAMDLNKVWIYLIALGLMVLTVKVAQRLERSRLGRAFLALREDEIACQAAGVNVALTKLTALTLGSFFAGLAGVIFAAQITYINPSSFAFMESIYILAIVVLGGLGSTPGVVLGAVIITILPEFLRGLDHYRLLIFGGLMVLMMVFRPQGLIKRTHKGF